MTIKPKPYGLEELELETQLGGEGVETDARSIPVIDLTDFANRKAEITEQLWQAAQQCGFFQLANHGIARADMDAAFERAKRFFDLPSDVKSKYPLRKTTNVGWEYMDQVRPSTQLADQKESYQITRPLMDDLWPTEQELPDFKEQMLAFEAQCWRLGMSVLSCFADKLGFDTNFFSKAHDPESDEYKSTLRLLHYFKHDENAPLPEGEWRAGAHTDFDCLTLLLQRDGQGGLQVCPGKEATSGIWTPVNPDADLITCNIGDMMMRWSDDQLRSTLHRVRMPKPGEARDARYSLGFFCQANESQIIQGPGKKYPPISAIDYLDQRLAANFAGLQHDD